MTADLLRRAAAKLRETAEAATPGPWWSDDSAQCWRLHGVGMRLPAQGLIPEQVVNKQILKAPKHGTPYAEYWPDPADAALIEMFGPPVALALAGWLDSYVRDDAPFFERDRAFVGVEQAVAVARAVLREDGESE